MTKKSIAQEILAHVKSDLTADGISGTKIDWGWLYRRAVRAVWKRHYGADVGGFVSGGFVHVLHEYAFGYNALVRAADETHTPWYPGSVEQLDRAIAIVDSTDDETIGKFGGAFAMA